MRKFVVAAFALMSAVPAFAKVYTYEYTAQISQVVDQTGNWAASTSGIPGALYVGDAVHGTFSYESSIPLSYFSVPEYSYYPNSPESWDIQAPKSTVTIDRSGTTLATSTSAPSLSVYKYPAVSAFLILGNADYTAPGASQIQFQFMDSPLIQSPLDVPTSLALGDYQQVKVWFNYNTADGYLVGGQGALTSLNNITPVPEPDAYAMFLAALALVGGVKRMQRRGKASGAA